MALDGSRKPCEDEFGNFALLNDPNMVFDVSGPGNLFSPETLTGQAPGVRVDDIGKKRLSTT